MMVCAAINCLVHLINILKWHRDPFLKMWVVIVHHIDEKEVEFSLREQIASFLVYVFKILNDIIQKLFVDVLNEKRREIIFPIWMLV